MSHSASAYVVMAVPNVPKVPIWPRRKAAARDRASSWGEGEGMGAQGTWGQGDMTEVWGQRTAPRDGDTSGDVQSHGEDT